MVAFRLLALLLLVVSCRAPFQGAELQVSLQESSDGTSEYWGKVVRVVDGDTLDIIFELGFGVMYKTRVRLYGVDTPETYGVKQGSDEYKAGKNATALVEEWVDQSANDQGKIKVVTVGDKKGKYGRYLVFVFSKSGEQLNEILKEKGWQSE